MHKKENGKPEKELWDQVSEDYRIEISEEETAYAQEIAALFQKAGIRPSMKLLELGSGSGHLSACLAQMGYKVSLLDFSSAALEKSKQTFAAYGLHGTFLEGDLTQLHEISDEYSLVWNSGVMEHFSDENLIKVFSQIAACCKHPFLFLVPNPESVAYLLMRYNLEGRGTWGYGEEYLRNNYLDLAKEAGLDGKVLGYAASSISVWHFESSFLTDQNRHMYQALVEDGLMPKNESYLKAYLVERTGNKDRKGKAVEQEKGCTATASDRAGLDYEGKTPEKYFRICAQKHRLAQDLKQAKEDLTHFQKEAERLLEANQINENRLLEIKKEKITAIHLLESEKEEIHHKYETLCKENEGLQQEKKHLLESVQQKEDAFKEVSQLLPQASQSLQAIRAIFHAKGFYRMVQLHAALGAVKRERIGRKIKITAKLLLRAIGIRKPLHIEGYRMDLQAEQYLRNVEHIIRVSGMGSTEAKKSSTASVQMQNNKLPVKTEECLYAKEPLISVLMPVYNHAAFVEEAIKAVQDQAYTNWELLILNDGSTDGLLDKIKDYLYDPRIRVFTQDNQRLPNALSNLHHLASGELITWTSADNLMEADMLKQLCAKLTASPGAVMVYADVMIIDENGSYVTAGYRESNRDREFPYVMRLPHCTQALNAETDNFINACFLYRAQPVKAMQGLYAPDLEGLEDYDFWLRLYTFGEIVHIRNEKPLYRYRVHKNTMSEQLLTTKMEEHAKRAEKLIAYSHDRDRFAEKGWEIRFEQAAFRAKAFRRLLSDMHYDYQKKNGKTVVFTDAGKLCQADETQLAVTWEGEAYHIYVKEKEGYQERAKLYQGYDVNPLAKKTRQTMINGLFWEYPADYAGMQVLGCHLDLHHIKVEQTIRLLQKNPEYLFSFCMTEGTFSDQEAKQAARRIQQACGNAVFMGEREFGSPVSLYASWDAAFLPPLKSKEDLMPMILLGWNIGKWAYVEEHDWHGTLPFVASYDLGEKLLGIKQIANISQAEAVLDAYIENNSITGAVKRLFQYLNGIGQDCMVKRPDFQLAYQERKFPPKQVENRIAVPKELKHGFIAMMADSLDKGGLEQVIALLARKFRSCGLEVVLFCAEEGGEIAQELAGEGFQVEIFHGDAKKFEAFICAHKPLILNTHYTRRMLETAAKHDIPIVDVIHNMYVFQDAPFFKREKEQSSLFAKMIAVSSIAKEAYVKKVNADPTHIEVVENAASSHVTAGLCREYVRELLGIRQDAFVFLNVSSIDSRKNQLGLVRAFEIFCRTVEHHAYLVLAGNVLSEFYNRELENQIAMGTCQERILKLPYHKNIGDLYHAADVFVMPSYFEGWSIAATEALYCGLPVIHSLCGSARELVSDGENGILIANPAGEITKHSHEQLMELMSRGDCANLDELVRAMMQAYKDREDWKEKGRSIAAKSMMRWNEDRMVEGYLKVFAQYGK